MGWDRRVDLVWGGKISTEAFKKVIWKATTVEAS